MQSKQITILLLSVISIFFSCKEKSASVTIDAEKKPTTTTHPDVVSYPALRNEDISSLYAVTDKADIIFYELPISVNQDEEKSAKSSVLYISPAPVKINKGCKPLGRISFMSDGAIIKEADFYADSLCNIECSTATPIRKLSTNAM